MPRSPLITSGPENTSHSYRNYLFRFDFWLPCLCALHYAAHLNSVFKCAFRAIQDSTHIRKSLFIFSIHVASAPSLYKFIPSPRVALANRKLYIIVIVINDHWIAHGRLCERHCRSIDHLPPFFSPLTLLHPPLFISLSSTSSKIFVVDFSTTILHKMVVSTKHCTCVFPNGPRSTNLSRFPGYRPCSIQSIQFVDGTQQSTTSK